MNDHTRAHMRRVTRYFLIAIAMLCAVAGAERLPKGWDEYVRLDQGHNVPSRADEVLSAEERRIIPIFSVEIPRVMVESAESEFLDDEMRANVIVKREGKDRFRFYFTGDETKLIEKLKSRNIEIKNEHWGTKMQSHSTYLVWSKDERESRPFFVKMQRTGTSNGKEVTWNSAENATLSVGNNDVVEKSLPVGGEDPEIGVLTERFGAGFELGGMKFANTFRSAIAIDEKDGSKLLPLHGFLGKDGHINPYARKMGLSRDEWYEREYLPKLARFMAKSQLKYGLHFESHTQNLLVRLDPKTGEIKGFVARDMNDVLFDPFSRVASGLIPQSMQDMRTSELNRYFVDLPEAREAGWHFAAYDSQSVFDQKLPAETKKRLARIYFDNYKREAEAVIGKTIMLGERGQKAYDSLAPGAPAWVETPDRAKYGVDVAAAGVLFQDFHDRATEARAPPYDPTKKILYRQSTLARLFREKLGEDEVALLFPDVLARLRSEKLTGLVYTYDGRGIYAYDEKSGRPLAYAHALTKFQREEAARPPNVLARFTMWCGAGLRGLFGQ